MIGQSVKTSVSTLYTVACMHNILNTIYTHTLPYYTHICNTAKAEKAAQKEAEARKMIEDRFIALEVALIELRDKINIVEVCISIHIVCVFP